MDILIKLLNNFYIRLFAGIVVASTAALPVINGFTDNLWYGVMGGIVFVITLFSVIFDFQFQPKHKVIILAIIISFTLLVFCIYMRWGR